MPNLILSPKDIERFWSKVDRDGPVPEHCPEIGRCWLYRGADDGLGYRRFHFGYQTERAHRVSFFLANGHWPTPCGLHRCDNRQCCNPEHIFEGTKADNAADKRAKGRDKDFTSETVRGSRSWNAKLTEDDVREIHSLVQAGVGTMAMASRFGICPSVISEIKAGRRWAHVKPAQDQARAARSAGREGES